MRKSAVLLMNTIETTYYSIVYYYAMQNNGKTISINFQVPSGSNKVSTNSTKPFRRKSENTLLNERERLQKLEVELRQKLDSMKKLSEAKQRVLGKAGPKQNTKTGKMDLALQKRVNNSLPNDLSKNAPSSFTESLNLLEDRSVDAVTSTSNSLSLTNASKTVSETDELSEQNQPNFMKSFDTDAQNDLRLVIENRVENKLSTLFQNQDKLKQIMQDQVCYISLFYGSTYGKQSVTFRPFPCMFACLLPFPSFPFLPFIHFSFFLLPFPLSFHPLFLPSSLPFFFLSIIPPHHPIIFSSFLTSVLLSFHFSPSPSILPFIFPSFRASTPLLFYLFSLLPFLSSFSSISPSFYPFLFPSIFPSIPSFIHPSFFPSIYSSIFPPLHSSPAALPFILFSIILSFLSFVFPTIVHFALLSSRPSSSLCPLLKVKKAFPSIFASTFLFFNLQLDREARIPDLDAFHPHMISDLIKKETGEKEHECFNDIILPDGKIREQARTSNDVKAFNIFSTYTSPLLLFRSYR